MTAREEPKLWELLRILAILMLKNEFAPHSSSKGAALNILHKNEKAIEIDPSDAMGWYNNGAEFVQSGNYEGAIKCFNKAIELDPKFGNAWGYKGALLAQSGMLEEALMPFDKAIEISPNYSLALNNKRAALEKLGRNDEAAKRNAWY